MWEPCETETSPQKMFHISGYGTQNTKKMFQMVYLEHAFSVTTRLVGFLSFSVGN